MPSYDVTPLSGVLLISAFASLCLARKAFHQAAHPLPFWFGCLAVSIAGYCASYSMELASLDLGRIKFWIDAQFIFISFLPAFLLLLVICFCRQSAPSPMQTFSLLGLSLITLTIHLSNDWHHLNFSLITFQRIHGISISEVTIGPWYYLHASYVNLAAIFSGYAAWRHWKFAPSFYRPQALLLTVAILIPWVCFMLFLCQLTPWGLDLSPFGLILTLMLLAVAMFRYRLTELVPIAREQIFDCLQDVVLVTDSQDRLIDFNQRARMMFPALSYLHVGQKLASLMYLPAALRNGNPGKELHINGCHYECNCHFLQFPHSKVTGQVIMLHDISERQQLIGQLRDQAERDDLTGLLNRRAILQRLSQLLNPAQARPFIPCSVLLFDIDFFKQINDSAGHHAGDQILQRLASLLQSHFPASALCGRYGGDEFLVSLPGQTEHEAVALAEQLNVACGESLSISLSIGIASALPMESPRELIHRADSALYQAKHAGRHCTRVATLPFPVPTAFNHPINGEA